MNELTSITAQHRGGIRVTTRADLTVARATCALWFHEVTDLPAIRRKLHLGPTPQKLDMLRNSAGMLAKTIKDRNADKRASLLASKTKWSQVDEQLTPSVKIHGKIQNYKQDSIQQWLNSSCLEEGKPDCNVDASAPLKKQTSGEDDLVLGVEASVYGKKPAPRTVQELFRAQQVSRTLIRWNSQATAYSTQSGALSVMDVLNLWNDDPEEVLLELGFGSEEPDISVRIPARFINHPSKARGINIQVFLEAQKNRMDLENPDVSHRFRQLEVLQQVTSAFSSLVPSPDPPADLAQIKVSAASRERRKRLGMLFRRASKKTLSMNQSQQSTPPVSTSANHSQEVDQIDRRPARKHSRPGPAENTGLTPVVEEQSADASRDISDPPARPPAPQEEGPSRSRLGMDPISIAPRSPLRRKSPGDMKTPESFEMEEVSTEMIHSFDEGGAGRSAAEFGDTPEAKFMRTNSCQSDSSGFMEEPVIPSFSSQASPVPELMKALHNLSGDSTDSQITVKEIADIAHTTDYQIAGEGSTDVPNGLESQTTRNESTDISKSMDFQINSKESADISREINREMGLKERDIPSISDSPTNTKETIILPSDIDSPDIHSNINSPVKIQDSADIAFGADSQTTVKEDFNAPYGMGSPITEKDSSFISSYSNSPITVQECADISNGMNSQIPAKISADIPNSTDSLINLKDCADIPDGTHSLMTVDFPYNYESSTSVKENADIQYNNDSLFTVSKCADISNSAHCQTAVIETVDISLSEDSRVTAGAGADSIYTTDCSVTVTDSPDILCNTESQICEKGSVDIPSTVDNPDRETESAFITYGVDRQRTAKEHTDFSSTIDKPIHVKQPSDDGMPNGIDCRMTLNKNTDFSYTVDSPVNVTQCTDIPYRTDRTKLKQDFDIFNAVESNDIPSVTDGQTSVKEYVDISYRIDNQVAERESTYFTNNIDGPINVKENTDIPNAMHSHNTVKESMTFPSNKESRTNVKENVGSPCRANSPISVNESGYILYNTDHRTTVRGSSDIPYHENETSDLACNADSQSLVKNLELSSKTESGITQMQDSDIPDETEGLRSQKQDTDSPHRTDSDNMLNGSANLSWCSPHDHQGSAESPRTAVPECVRTKDREEVEVFQNPLVEIDAGSDPGKILDDSKSPGPESGYGIQEFASSGDPEVLLCSKCKSSLQSQGGNVAQKGGAERGRHWWEERMDVGFPHQEEAVSQSCRPDWASFGSSKSVSVQMPSSLPSVSQTTRRRCPAAPLDLQQEIANAMAIAASSSHSWRKRKPSRGTRQKRSASLDMGRAREEEEGEEEAGFWEAGSIAGMRCCCVCDPRCLCHTHHPAGEHGGGPLRLEDQTTSHSTPFTLDELEGMMRCMQKFRFVLQEMEMRLQEEEAQVYDDFSHLDREDVASIQELRTEVKREAELLEMQLSDLALHCDSGIPTKMQRLLDEQSQLCVQLRVPFQTSCLGPAHCQQVPPTGPIPGPVIGRSVATQCCLLPDLLVSGASVTGDLLGMQYSSSPPEGVISTAEATDKQDFLANVGFFQSIKDSLQHSNNIDG
ncbi:hypothetical protein GJAV_G00069370 [Gymnothorax javanicus]|nr:hypothetical protein GJAV_G00069370 [Gymnothorax javanicus]